MPVLTAGYWPTAYWAEDYWVEDYWQDPGDVGPTPFPLCISISQAREYRITITHGGC